MKQRALACAADGRLAEGISQIVLVILGYSTERGNGVKHVGKPSLPVQGTYRAVKHALMCQRTAVGRESIEDTFGHLTSTECHCCAGHTEGTMQRRRRW